MRILKSNEYAQSIPTDSSPERRDLAGISSRKQLRKQQNAGMGEALLCSRILTSLHNRATLYDCSYFPCLPAHKLPPKHASDTFLPGNSPRPKENMLQARDPPCKSHTLNSSDLRRRFKCLGITAKTKKQHSPLLLITKHWQPFGNQRLLKDYV